MNRLVALLLLACIAARSAVWAQVGAPPPEAPPARQLPQYQVELIVFAHRDFDPSEERFEEVAPTFLGGYETLQQPPVFDDSNYGPLAQTPNYSGGVPAIAASPEQPFRLLRSEELQLGAQYRRIQALGAYRPLVHTGWVQAALPEAQSQPFDLALAGVANPRGNVRVYLSRFLHINLDLTYQPDVRISERVAASLDDPREISFGPRYRLLTSRQTRSGELHYFDHPAFGVIVRVTPVTPETGAAQSGQPAA